MKLFTTVEFDSAHRLSFHTGKCKNLHGHRWKAEVEIELDKSKCSSDMLIDFGIVKESITKKFDHKTLVYKQDDVMMELAEIFEHLGLDYEIFNFELTAENLAEYICNEISTLVAKQKGLGISDIKVKVKLFETPNNSVEFIV